MAQVLKDLCYANNYLTERGIMSLLCGLVNESKQMHVQIRMHVLAKSWETQRSLISPQQLFLVICWHLRSS